MLKTLNTSGKYAQIQMTNEDFPGTLMVMLWAGKFLSLKFTFLKYNH